MIKHFGLKDADGLTLIDLLPKLAGEKRGAQWTTKFVNSLPDSSFAYVSPDKKTRKLPYKDESGKVDLPHLRNALSRLDQTDGISDADKKTIRTKLENILKKQSSDVAPVDAPDKLELLQTGMWDTPYHGMFMITDDDLQAYVQNWNDGLRKGLPIDYEHDDDGGAAGWITSLYIAPSSKGDGSNALWGNVDWTPEASQQISDGVYKYFSPEFWPDCYPDPETGDLFDNVFIGGGLTNRPLFKNLTSVRATEQGKDDKKVLTANSVGSTIYLRKASQMNLKDIFAKLTNKEDLNDEEKAHVVEHKEELDDDQTKAATDAGILEATADGGDNDDGAGTNDDDNADDDKGGNNDDKGTAGDIEGDKQAKDTVAITGAELDKLKKQAADGAAALEMLHKKQASEKVKGWLFNEKDGGHFPLTMEKDVTSFYGSLTASQQTAFEKLVDKMPAATLFGVKGADSQVNAGSGAYEKLKVIAEDKIKASENKLGFAPAMKQARDENPELSEQYLAEVGA
jgi:phage I-like protein